MTRMAVIGFFVASALSHQSAQVGRPVNDGDVRSHVDGVTKSTHTYLTLVLRNAKGPLPVNLVVETIAKARARKGEAPDVELRFDAFRMVGPGDLKPPHVSLVVDRKLPTEKILYQGAVDPGTVIGQSESSIIAPFSPADLEKLATASRVDGRFLGLEFSLTAKQMQAIKAFAARR